jgi:predicted ATP-binding protein involved in virulence
VEQLYIKEINILKVRHLHNLKIIISSEGEGKRHLILTGNNGSGKTSLLEAIQTYLYSVSKTNDPYESRQLLEFNKNALENAKKKNDQNQILQIEKSISSCEEKIEKSAAGVDLEFSKEPSDIKLAFEHGDFILSYYGATRAFHSPEPKHVEKTILKDSYSIKESTRSIFLSYLLDLKMTQALAIVKKDNKKAQEIEEWFDRLQEILRGIYDDPSLLIKFNEDTFKFSLIVKNREPFDFNTASDGFSAILDIVIDLILRMQRQDKRVTKFLMPGVVLIDEIENHLHLELQKKVLSALTELFPNIQFIVTTHSPFVLNSIANATVYDLERHILVKKGLSDASYSGIVEGYFKQDELSSDLREKLNEYRSLTKKHGLDNADYMKIALLETCLDEIPDYIDIAISTEYQKLKLEFESRGDLG